jgi:predicted nucleic acid-binding Zn ribbon protein
MLTPDNSDTFQRSLPQVPLEPDDGIDEPLQCVYCGKLTREDERTCPHCRQNLMWRKERQKEISDFLRMGMLLTGILMAIGLVEALGPLLAVSAEQWGDSVSFSMILGVFGVKEFLGDFLKFPPVVAQTLVSVYLLHAGVLLFLLFGLSQRLSLAYYSTILLMIIDFLGSIFLAISGYLGWFAAGVNVIFILAILGLLFSSDREFAVNEERLFTRPDMTARSALDFYKRGHHYRKLGMWSLAVAQWRKAVGLAPKEVQYYKDLGVGYAQIKRFERSLRVLEEAQHQAPYDAEIPEMIKLVRQQAASGRL